MDTTAIRAVRARSQNPETRDVYTVNARRGRHEEIEREVAEFLAKGNHIEEVPAGTRPETAPE